MKFIEQIEAFKRAVAEDDTTTIEELAIIPQAIYRARFGMLEPTDKTVTSVKNLMKCSKEDLAAIINTYSKKTFSEDELANATLLVPSKSYYGWTHDKFKLFKSEKDLIIDVCKRGSERGYDYDEEYGMAPAMFSVYLEDLFSDAAHLGLYPEVDKMLKAGIPVENLGGILYLRILTGESNFDRYERYLVKNNKKELVKAIGTAAAQGTATAAATTVTVAAAVPVAMTVGATSAVAVGGIMAGTAIGLTAATGLALTPAVAAYLTTKGVMGGFRKFQGRKSIHYEEIDIINFVQNTYGVKAVKFVNTKKLTKVVNDIMTIGKTGNQGEYQKAVYALLSQNNIPTEEYEAKIDEILTMAPKNSTSEDRYQKAYQYAKLIFGGA